MRGKKKIKSKDSHIGIHIVADFWGGRIIESSHELKILLTDAARKGNNTPLKFALHKFLPQGITGVVLLAESHISFHAWPEFAYTSIDIFTCGKNSKPEESLKFFRKELLPQTVRIRRVKRGERDSI